MAFLFLEKSQKNCLAAKNSSSFRNGRVWLVKFRCHLVDNMIFELTCLGIWCDLNWKIPFGWSGDRYLLIVIGPPNLTFEFFFKIQKVPFFCKLTQDRKWEGSEIKLCGLKLKLS